MKLHVPPTFYGVSIAMIFGLATCGWAQSSTIDFENYTLGNVDGQFGWNGQNANATVTDVNPLSGTQSLLNDGSAANSWPYYSYGVGTLSSGCSLSLEMQVVTDTSSSVGNGFYISPAPGSATSIWISFVGGNIRSWSYNNTQFQYWQTVGTYTAGDVYQIDVNNIQYSGANNPATMDLEITDLTTSTTAVSDPGAVASVVDFSPWATSDYAVVLASYGGGSALYDNITFTPAMSVPEPSAVALFVSGGFLMMLMLWKRKASCFTTGKARNRPSQV